MELEEVLNDIRTLKAECEMLIRITTAVDQLEREQQPALEEGQLHQVEKLVYLH